jgi:DNA invertase Pin-like site-specific DNA recombinase
MIVGYARTSTIDQTAGFEAQLRELAPAGCGKIFQEQVSSVAERKQLHAAMELRPGERHLRGHQAGSARPLRRRLDDNHSGVGTARVGVRILNLDTHTPTCKLMLTVLGAIAQF